MGVRAVKGPFKRLTVSLPCDAYARYRILLSSVHLCNFRTRFVGLNQIRTVCKDKETTAQTRVKELADETDMYLDSPWTSG